MVAGYAWSGLVGHVRVLLVDVDRRAVEVREAHREAAAVHEAGLRADPGAGVVVVVRVHPDAVRELDLGVRRPVGPVDAVGAARDGRRDARVLGLRTARAGCRRRRPAGRRDRRRRAGRDDRVQRDLEAVCACTRPPARCVSGAVGIDVRGRAHALPLGDDAAGRAERLEAVEVARRAAGRLPGEWSSPLITTAAFSPRGRYQKRGSGILSASIGVIRLTSSRCCSSACGIAILLVSSQSGWTSPLGA